MVEHNIISKSMKLHDLLQEKVSNVNITINFMARGKVGHFGEPINYNLNGVVSLLYLK